jgi:ATP-dependent DNA ligase
VSDTPSPSSSTTVADYVRHPLITAWFVLDGEAVVWSGGRLDFEALQARMTSSKAKLPVLVREVPASFAAFDLLGAAGHDIRGVPLSGRRELLEALAADWDPPLALSPATMDRDLAMTWFEEMPAAGLDGLVVKAAGQVYEGGVRQWLCFVGQDCARYHAEEMVRAWR